MVKDTFDNTFWKCPNAEKCIHTSHVCSDKFSEDPEDNCPLLFQHSRRVCEHPSDFNITDRGCNEVLPFHCSGKERGKRGKIEKRRKDGNTERHNDRKTERQKDRKTERRKDRKTARQKDGKTKRLKDRKTENRKTERRKNRKMERRKGRKTGSIRKTEKQKDRKTKRWKDRLSYIVLTFSNSLQTPK